jgi:hypothetical protein
VIFPTSKHGILDPRSQPCVVAHRQQELKPRNWAPKLAVFIFVDLGLKPLVSLGLILLEYCWELSMALAGPTHGTHLSSARGGGLAALFPYFFLLFWVAKCLNSRPQSWLNHMKPHEISILVTPGVLGLSLKWLCRT